MEQSAISPCFIFCIVKQVFGEEFEHDGWVSSAVFLLGSILLCWTYSLQSLACSSPCPKDAADPQLSDAEVAAAERGRLVSAKSWDLTGSYSLKRTSAGGHDSLNS